MSEKDVQISYGKGFDALLGVLAGARRPGSWFASGSLETPMPSVEVAGCGMLSFPVPPAQAQQLIASAERAPFGKGDQTLVDENIRKVWQISPAKVKISGKGWTAGFHELVRKIGEDLGCEAVAVDAEFYKLLVYEKGGFFLPHRDSEKAGGMFGTLVVTLPSAHDGGELVIRHAGREAVLDLRGAAPSEIQFGAFYADCEHEVRPLRAGYRVCLIYNLVQKKRKTRLNPPDHRHSIAEAAKLLAQWASGGQRPDKIVHLLEHHYTQATLSFSTLKGADAALAQVLIPAAQQAGCAAHLGIVHIEESGWAEYTGGGDHGRRHRHSHWDDDEDEESGDDEFDVGEVCEGSYYVDQWRAASDAPVEFGEIPIGVGEILPPGALDEEPPDESHFSEATGNEGASFERTYLRAALVIWPEDRFDHICASAGPDAALARLEQLVSAARKSSKANRQAAEEAVRRMARAVPPPDPSDARKAERVSRLLDALRRFGDAEFLLERAAPSLLGFYDGTQNRALLASIPVLGEKRAAELLCSVVRQKGPSECAAVIELWTSLARQHAKSRLLLGSTLDALLDAIATSTPTKPPARDRWGLGRDFDLHEIEEMRGSKRLLPEAVSAFLAALHASLCSARISEIVRGISAKPDVFPPENILLPALEKLTIPVAAGPGDLWAHCARHFLARSEHPPEPPRDWAQKVTLGGKSPLLRELEAFARDPQAQVHRFRIRKELRQEIHRAIDRAGLDMTHVTERSGSPQTLVCTKTRATHKRACKQYESDLSDMRRLLGLPSARAKGNASLVQRLRCAVGTH